MTSKCIGRFELKSVLGKGSMGVVFLAHDPQLDREVAIKTITLPKGLTDDRRRRLTESLMRESRLAARLRHPGIVQVFDAGEHQGHPYMVLERIDGEPLDRKLKQGAGFSVDFALRMLGEILEAIGHAHEQDIVHRDLKPANIMLEPGGRVRVMDFGIAFALSDAGELANGFSGTPRYMSPEQMRGETADPRSDVFSLGVVAYELLTGRKPFPQSNIEQLRPAICEQAHPSLHSIRQDLPADVVAVIDRALTKLPTERFASAGEMRDALRACSAAGGNGHATPSPDENPKGRAEILDFIRRRIERKGDFPATSEFLAEVTRAARSQRSSASSISNAILKDFALTNRILRMVNSPFYRGVGPPITTISRAVVVLGMDTILSVVGTLGIFEHFHNKSNVDDLKREAIQALMTALHSRQIAREINLPNAEEAFICGMLHHLGRLIVAFYFPEEFQDIQQRVTGEGVQEEQAARQVMGIGFRELAEGIAENWNMPDTVRQCIRGLPPDADGPLRGGIQMLQGVVSMAHELGQACLTPDENRRNAVVANIQRRFEGRIRLSRKCLNECMEASVKNAWDISHSLRVDLQRMGLAEERLPDGHDATRDRLGQSSIDGVEASWPADDPGPAADPSLDDDTMDETIPGDETAAAAQRQDVFVRTVGEIMTALMGPFQINDVLMMILEGMYRGVGFRHVLLGMVSPQREHVYCRFGLGPDMERIQQAFHFPLSPTGGLPATCILSEKEVYVSDVRERKHGGGFKPELLELLGAKTVVLLPIIVNGRAIGLFFVDRNARDAPVTKTDMRDLRTLVNQAVLTIQHSLGKRA